MSHFTVAVICEDPDYLDEILAPYQEYDGQEEFAGPLEFVDHTEELMKEYEEYSEECGKWDERKSFADFANQQYTINKEDEDSPLLPHECRWGYYHNPQSKWDWWQVGGRWAGELRTLDGKQVDYDLIKNIDFTPDKEKYDEAIRFWEVVVEGKPLAEGEEEPFNMWKPEYYIEQYGTKEKYAEDRANFATWAIIDKDGKWYEKGEMGWWAVSDATNESRTIYKEVFDRLLAEANSEDYLVIVDCHI